jgi:hypothetical protein
MTTRSTITAKLGNGKFGKIYCHWDGYPSNNGRILLESYTEQTKIDALIALGNLSILAPLIAPPEGVPHSFKLPADNVCVAYGRDRGETGTEAQIGDCPLGLMGNEAYNYFWNGRHWFCDFGRNPAKVPRFRLIDGEWICNDQLLTAADCTE